MLQSYAALGEAGATTDKLNALDALKTDDIITAVSRERKSFFVGWFNHALYLGINKSDHHPGRHDWIDPNATAMDDSPLHSPTGLHANLMVAPDPALQLCSSSGTSRVAFVACWTCKRRYAGRTKFGQKVYGLRLQAGPAQQAALASFQMYTAVSCAQAGQPPLTIYAQPSRF